MSKHTPGPWRVEPGTRLIWGACDPDDTTTNGFGFPVAEARFWSYVERRVLKDDEIEANAALIARAPELLEVLEAIVAGYSDQSLFFMRAEKLIAEIKGDGK